MEISHNRRFSNILIKKKKISGNSKNDLKEKNQSDEILYGKP